MHLDHPCSREIRSAAGPVLIALLLAFTAPIAHAQTDGAAASPPADPADVGSIDAIIAALYDVISGDAGAPRDWDRMRSLHIPEARLIPTGVDGSGESGYRAMTLEEWIEGAGRYFDANPFWEREVARTTERFGNVAHAFSTYDSRTAPDAVPFQRGINSIQLFHDGSRWWIVTIFWDSEREGNPIPDRYLP